MGVSRLLSCAYREVWYGVYWSSVPRQSDNAESRTLDSLAAEMEVQQIDVIKIDVEGAELGALQGAARILTTKRPSVIMFELADWAETRISGQRPGDAQAALLARGYRLFRLTGPSRTREETLSPLHHGTSMIWHCQGAECHS
jgi:hypothetical protein